MMIDAEMYGMTPIAKIDNRDRAPPENMFTMPRMVFDWSVKNRATSLGLIPGTGMNVPMRYTTKAPTRNSRRPRISPKRAASPKPAAGLLNVELATRVVLYVGLRCQIERLRPGPSARHRLPPPLPPWNWPSQPWHHP